MQLITAQRMRDEKLEWQEIRVERNPSRIINGESITEEFEFQVIDVQGNVYHGILHDDGKIEAFGGFVRYDSVATFEGFQNAAPAGLSKRHGIYSRTRH